MQSDHVVLASADSEAFTSLRRRSTSRQDRYRMGRELRRRVPRRSLGDWSAPAGRPDPVQRIIESLTRRCWPGPMGQRVVEYQQALQTVSDPLLGWTTVDGRQYYVRQFRNMKGSVALDSVDAAALADYAAVTGHLLAKGHARTSGASIPAHRVRPVTGATTSRGTRP